MVAIVNISDTFSEKGLQRYSVRINETEICQFLHIRENGLAACLMSASHAVSRHEEHNRKKK